uniref:Transmembrane protein n=1 Tax=Globodera rostochiensis TaxID=31243 RepID=A0A914H8U4_GLORO
MQQNFLPTIFVLLLLLVAFSGTFALKCEEGAGFGLVDSTAVECPNNHSFCLQVDCKTNNKKYPLFQRFECTTGSVRGDCTAMVRALADMDSVEMEGWSCTCYTDQPEAPHTVILVNVMEKNGSGGLLRVGIASVIAAALAAILAVTAL